MSDYQVLIDQIRSTGKASTRVADGLRGVACADAVPGGDAGMPGARSVAKLAAAKQAWQGREQRFVTQLDSHAESIGKAAELYGSNEAAAARDLNPSPQPTGGPKAI